MILRLFFTLLGVFAKTLISHHINKQEQFLSVRFAKEQMLIHFSHKKTMKNEINYRNQFQVKKRKNNET